MYLLVILAALSLTSFPGCDDPGPSGVSYIYDRVVVYNSDTAPPMNDPSSSIWNKASASYLRIGDTTGGYTSDFGDRLILVQAIKAAGRLYLKAEWSDGVFDARPEYILHLRDTSLIPFDTTFDTTDYNLPVTVDTVVLYDTTVDTSWMKQQAFTLAVFVDTILDPEDTNIIIGFDTTLSNAANDQDRFAIMWNTGENGSEGADCASMCHDIADTSVLGHRMYTTGGGHVDVWHWQAATSDPILLAHDEWWSSQGRESDETIRPLAVSNYDTINQRPLNMNVNDTAFTGRFLHADEAIPFQPVTAGVDWPNGYRMPGYVVDDLASGSVADVSSYSRWNMSLGRWSIIMSRELTTGHDDDFDFSTVDAGDSVQATIAVMDNADRLHSGTKPFYIIFP